MNQQDAPQVQEMEWRYEARWGFALYIRIYTPCYRQLSWTEVWETFSDRYPGRWAVQVFPPADQLVDEENIYHLFVFDSLPATLNIKARA